MMKRETATCLSPSFPLSLSPLPSPLLSSLSSPPLSPSLPLSLSLPPSLPLPLSLFSLSLSVPQTVSLAA